jgi:hypothetical protein
MTVAESRCNRVGWLRTSPTIYDSVVSTGTHGGRPQMEKMMTFRIDMGAVYTTVQDLADAQSEALDHARELTRACGFPVSVRVSRMGHPTKDELGRDTTPAFWIGSAVGRLEHRVARVSWVPAPSARPRVELRSEALA